MMRNDRERERGREGKKGNSKMMKPLSIPSTYNKQIKNEYK